MSNFTVSALKYRPQRFDEVVGQQHVSQTLKNALRSEHLAHAFLFCGPRGVGKTTCARILAKVLNCTSPEDDGGEPCNKCSSCVAFNASASFNITELDAASNNSVEHIRALIEQVRFQPQQGKYKVFIIDEVHMLSQQAFNAFLKTLEEPPSYAVFILATTEKHKIIPTILSRCQIFDFRSISVTDTVAHLRKISEQQGVKAEDEALHIIAEKAGGALRDALSIYDRMLSYNSEHIQYSDVIDQLNVLSYDYFFRLTEALLTENLSESLNLLDEILSRGFDPGIFILGFASHLRNLLVCKQPGTLHLLQVSERLQQQYRTQADIAPMSMLLSYLNLINECDLHYREAQNKRLHTEMCLMKMTFVKRTVVKQVPLEKEKKTEVVIEPQIVEEEAPDGYSSQKEQPVSESVKTPAVDTAPAEPEEDMAGKDENTLAATEVEKEPETETEEEYADTVPTYAPPVKETTKSSMSLKGILADAQENLDEDNRNDAVSVTIEAVKECWENYTEEKVKSDFIRSTLRQAKVSLSTNGEIHVRCSSKLARDNIRSEKGLIQELRKTFAKPNLKMNVLIDAELSESKKQKKAVKPVTDREKYKALVESNPTVNDLRKRFDLRPE